MRSRLILAVAVLIAALAVAAIYSRDMDRIRDGVTSGSTLIDTRHGPVEVAFWGEGPVVLVLHGAGGGQDQGRLIVRMFGGDGFRWVAVSRFGYLRSPLPADGSTRAQAEALADVLDALKVQRAGLLAMSGGVPPALQFASLYPDRTKALALLSTAPFAPLTAASQDLPLPAWAYRMLFATDLPVWAVLQIAPWLLDRVFDVTPALRARLSAQEAAEVQAMVAGFLPVTDRLAGLANEGAAIDPSATVDLAGITAPALVVHARDDGINPFPIAEFLAAGLPGVRFLVLETGGHLLLGNRDAVRAAVDDVLGRLP